MFICNRSDYLFSGMALPDVGQYFILVIGGVVVLAGIILALIIFFGSKKNGDKEDKK